MTNNTEMYEALIKDQYLNLKLLKARFDTIQRNVERLRDDLVSLGIYLERATENQIQIEKIINGREKNEQG